MVTGKININKLFEPSRKTPLERMKDVAYGLAVEISDLDGNLWASPDICNILVIASNLKFDEADLMHEKPEFCGYWLKRKVYVDINLVDEWELR